MNINLYHPPVAIIASAIVFAMLFYHHTDANSINLHVSRVMIVLGAGLLLLWYTFLKNQNTTILTINLSVAHYLLLFLLLFASLSVFWSENTGFFVFKWLFYLTFLVFFILGNLIDNNTKNLIKLFNILLIGASIVATIGILQHLFLLDFFFQTVPPAATLGNKNMVAHIMVLILPLGFYLFVTGKKGIGTYLSGVAVVVVTLYIFYTKTRSAWLAVALEWLFVVGYLLFNQQRKTIGKEKTVITILSIFFLLLMVNISSSGWTPVFEVLSNRVSDTYQSIVNTQGSSQNDRYAIWLATLNMIVDNPVLGSGLGSFFYNLSNEGYANYKIIGVKRVHNDFLELAVELGLIGVFVLFAIIITTTARIIKAIKHNFDNNNGFLLYMLTIAIIASMVNALFSFPYQMIIPVSIAGIYIGILFGMSHEFDVLLQKIQLKINKNNWRLLILVISLLLVFVVYVYNVWLTTAQQTVSIISHAEQNQKIPIVNTSLTQPFQISKLYKIAGATYDKGHYNGSIALLKQIQKIMPNDFSACLQIAYAQMAQKQYKKTLDMLDNCKPSLPRGSYASDIFKLSLYKTTNNRQALIIAYNKLKLIPEKLLAIQPATYLALVDGAIALANTEDMNYFYTLFNKYHQPSLQLELKILQYYLTTKQYNLALNNIRKVQELGGRIPNKLIQFLQQICSSSKCK